MPSEEVWRSLSSTPDISVELAELAKISELVALELDEELSDASIDSADEDDSFPFNSLSLSDGISEDLDDDAVSCIEDWEELSLASPTPPILNDEPPLYPSELDELDSDSPISSAKATDSSAILFGAKGVGIGSTKFPTPSGILA